MEWPSAMANGCGPKPCACNQKCVSHGKTFDCHDVDCSLPPVIKNSKIVLLQQDAHFVGDMAEVKCEAGYVPEGATVVCQVTGLFSSCPAAILKVT